MAQSIREVMTPAPVTLPANASLTEAARLMKEHDIGDVIVLDDGKVCGVVTDRDIVVRAVAENRDPSSTEVAETSSRHLVSLSPTDSVDDAILLMREHAVRRVPVIVNGEPVGIVSIGDLALERDSDSALADISAAPASN